MVYNNKNLTMVMKNNKITKEENDMNKIRKSLFEKKDLKYKEFHSSLCPNVDKIIGVRVPKLRKMAKEIATTNYEEFFAQVEDEYYEELLLQGLVIGYLKVPIQQIFKSLKIFVPKINSWAVCDTTCSNLKITKKHMQEMWKFLEQYANSNKEYEIRFALVMYLNYYLTEDYIQEILQKIDNIKSKEYYVQMAIAWLVSFAYIKQKEKTEKYLLNNNLDKFTLNKSIQKICESYRVSDEDKKKLIKLKK